MLSVPFTIIELFHNIFGTHIISFLAILQLLFFFLVCFFNERCDSFLTNSVLFLLLLNCYCYCFKCRQCCISSKGLYNVICQHLSLLLMKRAMPPVWRIIQPFINVFCTNRLPKTAHLSFVIFPHTQIKMCISLKYLSNRNANKAELRTLLTNYSYFMVFCK